MIVMRLKIPLDQHEYSSLLKIATDELRDPTDQARYILRQFLEQRGFTTQDTSGDCLEKSCVPHISGDEKLSTFDEQNVTER